MNELHLAQLATVVRWCVLNDGECMGDHPMILKQAKAALAAISTPLSETTYRSIESAPKDAHGIIAYSPTFYRGNGGWVAAVWLKDGWHSNPGAWRFEPTHWIPMPGKP